MIALPLLPLTLLGMEHTLAALLCIALIGMAIRAIALGSSYGRVSLLSALAVSCRYELVVVVLLLSAFAAYARRWGLILALGLPAGLILGAFGLLWHAHGGWFLPNSLIVKADLPTGFHTLLAKMQWDFSGRRLISSLTLIVLTVLTAVLTLRSWRHSFNTSVIWCLIAILASGAQFFLGAVGWLYRYESWVLFLDAVACFVLVPRPAMLALLALLLLPRGYADARDTTLATQDRLLEHIAPARFIAQYFPSQEIAINDIGAVSWLNPRTTVLDLYGLGANEPIRLRKLGLYDAAHIEQWTRIHNVQIAILQACWPEIHALIPSSWTLVETWILPRNTIFHDFTVAFYAVDPTRVTQLRTNLAQFPVDAMVQRRLVAPDASSTDVRSALGCQ